MIGHRFPAVGPVPAGTGGWASAVTISLVAHGVLIGALLLTDGDISPPVAPQVFTVDVVMEAAPSSAEPAAANPARSAAALSPAPIPRTAEAPATKTPATARRDPAPATAQNQLSAPTRLKQVPASAVKAVYAPIPKSKPVLMPRPVSKKPGGETRPAAPGNIAAETPTAATPQQSASLPDTDGTEPNAPANEAEGGATAGALVPPQLAAHGGGNPLPPYPRAARRQGLEGRLVLRVTVTVQGTPGVVKVLESSGHALLDDAAVRAVMRWRFQPGRRGSTPVQASLDLPVVFRLKSER